MTTKKALTRADLDSMSRADKLAMLDLLEEKNRRDRERPDHYEPNDGQLPVHKSTAALRAVFAGNGGGKTALGVNEAIWACNGFNPVTKIYSRVPARVIVVLDKPDKVADVWLPEIKKWYALKPEQLHKRGKPHYSQITFPNGSEILFMFHDQEPMSFESIELDMAIFDEPPPRHVYVALRRGGRKKGTVPRYLIIGTPIGASWLRKEIYEPWARGEHVDIECFRYGTRVNEHNLADGFVESFSRVLSEKEKQIRLEGSFDDLDGLALAHLFDRTTHLVDAPRWPAMWPVILVVDFHPRKAHVAILVGITPSDGLVYLKEMSSRAVPSKLAGELKQFYDGYRVVDMVCDSLGNSELTGGEGNASFIRVLNDNGVRIRATRYDEKNDESFIQMIQEALVIPQEADAYGKHDPRIKFNRNCKGIIADIETCEWQRFKNMDEYKPKLAIGKKDFLACLKYALATQPRFTKGRERIIRPKGPVGWNNNEKRPLTPRRLR